MTVCGWVNVLLVEGALEEPLGIEEEGGGRVRERLSITATDEGCCGLNLCETQTSKDHFQSCEDGFFDLEADLVMSFRSRPFCPSVCLSIFYIMQSVSPDFAAAFQKCFVPINNKELV